MYANNFTHPLYFFLHPILTSSTTYRPETTLNYGLERAWCIAATKDANKIAIGYDEGTVVLKLGNEKPVASLDTNSGEFWCFLLFVGVVMFLFDKV